MRMYKVLILPLAEEDIMNNTDYIAFEKKAPETALELAAREIRKCYYKNYKIYFFIDERSSTVYVLRVLHMLVNAKPLLLNMRL
ncbi:type II toxin-antitoxin system RelE/ParE family toxin [Blautia obeum]|uniref:type II toxin-antitoxin system RelE/ParE family toxin n=1 Tax=Blautia obeum TaxID=40520 RepID=UPI0034A2F94A